MLLGTALVGALGACGAERDTTPDVATRTVRDIDGRRVEVPADPRRVVTLSEPTLDGALALGVTPVGTVAGRGQSGVPNYLAEAAEGIAVIGQVAQPNYEAIARVAPDLILVDGTSINNNQDAIRALEAIAPVVVTGYAGGDWRRNFAIVADALNAAEQAQRVVGDYDALAAELADELAVEYADDTFAIVRWQGNAPSLILRELPAGVALTDLGLTRPPGQDRQGRGHSEPVSLENLDLIDADHMFFGTLGGSSVANPRAGGAADTRAAREALTAAEKVPGFTALRAYRTGGIILVDGSLWTSTGGPLLMEQLVLNVKEALS